jgi:DNA-binding transcriptional MerR regulator
MFRMRIGDFSQKFDISIDAARYYIENGLLLPEKVHNQYYFDEGCEEDIRRILVFKKMRFTITEIKMLFSLLRLTHLADRKDIDYYETFFQKKQEELLQEKSAVEEAMVLLKDEVERIRTQTRGVVKPYGIPIVFFSNFACPRCNESLELDKATVEGNMVYQGELNCQCGYRASITDGIVITPSAVEEGIEYLDHENPIRAYLDKTDPLFVSFTKKGFDWVMKRIPCENASQTILEIGSGFCFFLMNFIEKLPERTTYIVVENRIPLLQFAKKYFETNFASRKLVFIGSDFNELPIRKESVHCVLDLFGSTTHSFTNDFFPVQRIASLLKKEGFWLGSYLYFEPSEAQLKSELKRFRPMFDLERLQMAFSEFSKIESSRLAEIQVTADLHDKFEENSIVSMWVYKGKRPG